MYGAQLTSFDACVYGAQVTSNDHAAHMTHLDADLAPECFDSGHALVTEKVSRLANLHPHVCSVLCALSH